jgi:uncharacterized membrane protein YvbJ
MLTLKLGPVVATITDPVIFLPASSTTSASHIPNKSRAKPLHCTYNKKSLLVADPKNIKVLPVYIQISKPTPRESETFDFAPQKEV